MAPEVLEGLNYDSKADVWSLGCCFYEMLFGRPPYQGSSMQNLLKQIVNGNLTFPFQ
jgi:serine/threonine-protein kinase ULK/ATG1